MSLPEIQEIKVLKHQLDSYLPHLNEAEGAFSFFELCGFFVAVCSSPESIQPSEWMPVVLGDDLDIPEALGEPSMVLEAIMGLYNWINYRILTGVSPIPDELEVSDEVFTNFGDQAPVGQWSKGFYEGHDWLSEIWESVVKGEDKWEEELSSYLLPLSFFLDENYARAIYEDFARQDKTFYEVAEYMSLLFKNAAMDYANLGRMISEAIEEIDNPDEPKTQYDEPEVDRDGPCPCGSGKPYKKCCLH